MCGISTILPGSDLSVPPFAIDRMTAALRHRGPDAQATVRLPGCHLGHTRLSIIDPANGAQPMSDAAVALLPVSPICRKADSNRLCQVCSTRARRRPASRMRSRSASWRR